MMSQRRYDRKCERRRFGSLNAFRLTWHWSAAHQAAPHHGRWDQSFYLTIGLKASACSLNHRAEWLSGEKGDLLAASDKFLTDSQRRIDMPMRGEIDNTDF